MFEKLNQVGGVVIGATEGAGPAVWNKTSSALPYAIPGALMLGVAAILGVTGIFLAKRYCKPQDEAQVNARSDMAILEGRAEEGARYQRIETHKSRRHSVA
ncbi:MAG TPA: hypothetical protein DIC51_04350 [Coxiellaceae bacterium]|nr:hypothetical protein [Coxiellaceae bacterium]